GTPWVSTRDVRAERPSPWRAPASPERRLLLSRGLRARSRIASSKRLASSSPLGLTVGGLAPCEGWAALPERLRLVRACAFRVLNADPMSVDLRKHPCPKGSPRRRMKGG